ncbi:hypothetical protein AcW2_000682 [Taiwanofungus camphoratus]|nr:hypothetical protein AcW2_000682 [Antrodia cinnamomea]
MAPATTTTAVEQLCTQWTRLADDELTTEQIERLLKPVHDDLWVAAACVDRLLDDETLQRPLLDLGIERTQGALQRSKGAYENPQYDADEHDEGEADVELRSTDEQGMEQRRHVFLVSHFCDEPADAQLCLIRAVLLDRLDRLNTFVEICKVIPAEEATADGLDDEWTDDPWADETAEPLQGSSSALPGPPPISLSTFLTADLLQIACLLASLEYFPALRVLMERHGLCLWPYRFAILDSVPEHALASHFRELLPSYDASVDIEQKMKVEPWRSELDFSEDSRVKTALNDCGVCLTVGHSQETAGGFVPHAEPLPSSDLAAWYRDRVDLIISSTGMVDASLSLIQHAASQGLPGLDEVGEELSLLSRLVYDTPLSDKDADEEWTLARWKSMEPSAAVRAYLAHSTPEMVAKDINKLVMPYLFVLESRAERAGRPDSSLPNRLLYEYILNAPLDIVAAIFEASKPTLPLIQRLLRNDEDMARLALACLYGSDSLDEWATMSRIFECLPAWNILEQDEDEADEAETTITSLGAFVTPTTTRPRCTPADLMVFFNPLPSSSLSHALDVLDVHLESAEILARWSVPAPLRWFLCSNSSIAEQRSWASRMARRAGGSHDQPESQDDWEWLLEDMLKLSGSGESGSRSAFCLLSRDDVIRIFFSGLLSTGRFDFAKNLLHSSNIDLSLDPQVIEDICLTCSQEFYENASSGNYHFGDMKLAYDCLDLPQLSEKIRREKDFIEATSRLCSFNLLSRPGVPITPLEIRLTKDRLSLVSRVLSSNNDAYKHTQVVLDLVHKLGFKEDAVAEVKTLAMLAETALQAEDLTRAYETSERMIETVLNLRSSLGVEDSGAREASEVCWVACFQLGRHPEFKDVQKKLTLLGRTLELCPADRLPDVLTAWRRVEHDVMEERRGRLASRRNGTHIAPSRKHSHADRDAVSSLAARLHHLRMPDLHMPQSPLASAPDAAALANKAFDSVAASFPFSIGSKGRSFVPEVDPRSSDGEGSRSRHDGADVSAQASRVLQKGIGWLLGEDEDS